MNTNTCTCSSTRDQGGSLDISTCCWKAQGGSPAKPYFSTARTTEEEYSRAWGLFMLFHGNFSIHIHTVSIWYTLQVPANIDIHKYISIYKHKHMCALICELRLKTTFQCFFFFHSSEWLLAICWSIVGLPNLPRAKKMMTTRNLDGSLVLMFKFANSHPIKINSDKKSKKSK